jgi:hypothetical protein
LAALGNEGPGPGHEFEDHFIDDVIVQNIGEGTDGGEFDGGSYSVSLDRS